ncbi:hypothetical protein Mal15_20440 [Stieleria maiorica]|uniref:Uncharacterized protein n=1 Tax=Stieleria maiorica TaxID=2795974 RepID=A0A5B9MA53_9BACT|nr:hypothetical protein [Stieleria maiorica]QEF97998.1 hypothetical protein Mal15_20440 [Stieleria maiorica]
MSSLAIKREAAKGRRDEYRAFGYPRTSITKSSRSTLREIATVSYRQEVLAGVIWHVRFFAAHLGPAIACHVASERCALRCTNCFSPFKPKSWPERQALGASLADYAQNEGSDVGLFEDFDAAARRILSDGVTPKVTPETTSRWFDETADRVLANVREAKANIGNKRGKEFDSTITDLTILAHLARFHARRSLAAVHYNLYRRRQKPEELVAAARGEEMAIDAWRDLVNTAGNRYSDDLAMGPKSFNLGGHWRDELKILETNLSKLQAQAASVDAVPQAVAWSPRTTGDVTPPAVEHDPVSSARLLSPLRIVARVTDPSGVQSLKLRYRHVTQYEEYRELDFHPTERTNEYAATIPGGFLVPQWDVMYFIEVIDGVGNGAICPDFQTRAPYVIVELER